MRAGRRDGGPVLERAPIASRKRTRELFANVTRFSRDGLGQYSSLASDGRITVAEVTKLVRSIQANPQQFLFGRKER